MTGLYYFGARYYDPRTSVWQSPDPIIGDYLGADPQKLTNGGMYNPFNLGLYTYTYNAPVKLVDPDGNVVNILFGGLLGAASDLAIQGVMIATGAQDSISWGEVGVSAALGASGVGLASVAQKGYKTYKTAKQANRIRASIAKSKVANKASGFKKWSSGASKKGITKADDVIHVTPDGVALPKGPKHKIPDHYIENPHGRPGSYGEMVNGKFKEKLRIDPATPPGKKGPSYTHYHKDGKKPHYSPRPGDKDPGF